MSGKSLINAVSNVVNESLNGCILTYPHLELHESKRVVLKAGWNKPNQNVSVISGGGSGHEPFASGFVGDGMLSAAIVGFVYTSPPSSHVLHAIQCVCKNNKGCLVIIPNYTGDVLNFGLAIEKARHLKLNIEQVIVGEDCSIPEKELGRSGKRGLPGILLAIKVAGAMAQKGNSLEDVKKYVQLIANNIATCSVGLAACTMPGRGPMFELPKDEVEFGQGIHGEAGYKRIKLQTAAATVAIMLDTIIKTLKLLKGNSVVALINNFGGLSQLEQGIIVKEVVTQLQNMDIAVHRVYSGLLMTSLDSVGVHVTILKLPETYEATILDLLDDRTNAPRWPGCSYSLPLETSNVSEISAISRDEKIIPILGPNLNEMQVHMMKTCLEQICKDLIDQEKFINELDRGCGDGDCGTTHRQLSNGILLKIDTLPLQNLSALFIEIARIAEDNMGGTSGAIYSLLFTITSTEFSKINTIENWLEIWAKCCKAGLKGMMKYSKAQLGDKTMVDVLEPALTEFEKNLTLPLKEALTKVSLQASLSAEATKGMTPRAGRAAYVKQEKYLKNIDAGAFAAATWLKSIEQSITSI